MKVYLTMVKKEWLGYIRNRTFIILLILFSFIGISSPVFAKIAPMILESISSNGIEITIPAPTEKDAWVQFFKNINQLGLVGMLLIYSGQMSQELRRGTLINLLSKGLSRKTVVLAKFSMNFLLFFVGYLLSFALSRIYTGILFSNHIDFRSIIWALLLPFLFGCFLLSLELLGEILWSSTMGSLSLVGVLFLVQTLVALHKDWHKFLPLYLVTDTVKILDGLNIEEFTSAIIITILLISTFIVLSILVFNKKEIQ